MFSDSLHNAYMEVYEGIRDYNDYCKVQKDNTIMVMCHILMIQKAFSRPNSSSSEKGDFEWCKKIVTKDYNRALKGYPFCRNCDSEE